VTREDRQLPIVFYLNQRFVFDLLAIVEGGFAQLKTVKTSEADSQTKKSEVRGEVGASNVFAFLGINLGGERAQGQSTITQQESSEERVFTPASLFSRLRDILLDRKLLHMIDASCDIRNIQPGTFVEFEAVLNKNPLVHTLEGCLQFAELGRVVGNLELEMPTSKHNIKRRQGKSEFDMVTKLYQRFLQVICQPDESDLIARVTSGDLRCVLPVEHQYFADISPDRLLDGQYKVLGKVDRVVLEDENASINLLRRTPLALMPDESIDELLRIFEGLSNQFRIPDLETRVPGPAMLVTPIAIFL